MQLLICLRLFQLLLQYELLLLFTCHVIERVDLVAVVHALVDVSVDFVTTTQGHDDSVICDKVVRTAFRNIVAGHEAVLGVRDRARLPHMLLCRRRRVALLGQCLLG